MALSANSAGVVKGKFTIPSGIPSGAKSVVAVGAGGSNGSAIFAGQGTLERQVYQQQISIQETRWQSPPPPPPQIIFVRSPGLPEDFVLRGIDPLAETFTLNNTTQVSGVDLWFVGKPTSTTRVQIRETVAGVPSMKILAEAILTPDQIAGNVSAVTPPPTSGTITKHFALSGSGSLSIPTGVTSIRLTGNGSFGIGGVTATPPTYGNWVYDAAWVNTNNIVPIPTVIGTGNSQIPNNFASLPTSFTVNIQNYDYPMYGLAANEGIVFTRAYSDPPNGFSATYKGVSAAGTALYIRFGVTVISSGTTGVAAVAGLDTTATIAGVTNTFSGSAMGVTTVPSPTLKTVSVNGSVPSLVQYNVPNGGSLSVDYDVAYSSNVDSGQAAGSFAATRVTFSYPRTLLAGVEYAIVILCNDSVGSLSVAELGKFDVNAQRWITSQPYTIGVLLSSSNASTWTAHQDRDLTFVLLGANYTETSRTFNLGTVPVSAVTDLMLMSYAERPASDSFVQYKLTLPDSTVISVSDGQPVQLPAAITGNVAVSAVLSSNSLSPVLFNGTQIVAGRIATSAVYVTRAVPAGNSVRVKVIYQGVIPSGATVTLAYRGTDSNSAWNTIPYVSDISADDGFREFTHQLTGVTAAAVQIKVTLTGTTAARPRVRDLRVIVL